MQSKPRIKVIGSGVIGLSTARVLREAGHDVTIVSERAPQATTSAVAGACWDPYHVSGAKAADWARETYRKFISLLDRSDAGITRATLRRYFTSPAERQSWEASNPWTVSMREELRYSAIPHQQAHRDFADGVSYAVPVIHMPTYLDFLRSDFTIEHRRIEGLADELLDTNVLVNCTGLGSRSLADVRDETLTPVRGQLVIVASVSEVREVTFVSTGGAFEKYPIYIVPRGDRDLVLGGTYLPQTEDDIAPDPRETQRILDTCIAHNPALAESRDRIREVKVGLRPVREGGVRLELDRRSLARPVIHNYGHGGGGVTLSWGCALAVKRIIEQL